MDDRYHLTLTLHGQTSMQGWWARKATAERKFSAWIGERGDLPGVRITLVDKVTGETLAVWPKE